MKIKLSAELAGIATLMDTVRDIRKLSRQLFMQKMKEHGLDVTIEMLEVLHILWDKDNINQQEIVERTNRNKASLTSLIDNMTSRGLVMRNPDPNDRRNNLIALTKEGKLYQKKMIPILTEVYGAFQTDVSPHEIESATILLQKIYRKMTG